MVGRDCSATQTAPPSSAFMQFSTCTLSFESSVGRGVLSLDFKYFTRSIERCPTTKSGRFSLGNFFVIKKTASVKWMELVVVVRWLLLF